jgi:hypothetical protein
MSRMRTITITLGSLAAGATLATGITGLALAADTTPDPTSSTAAPSAASVDGLAGGSSGMHHGPDGGMRGMHGGPFGEALHGEFVVKGTDGTISTVQTIRGTVTAVGADSITVKADDGYVGTFAINSDTEVHTGLRTRPADGTQPTAPEAGSIADVHVGDVADVRGTGSASAATADEVHVVSAAQAAQ